MNRLGQLTEISGASNQLRPSWYIPGSIFKSAEVLQNLIKASSQDDVHPQAVLAAEALGAGILVAPERIEEGLEALGANKSYRLEQIRISIGLHHGNIQRAFQSSSPLLQFFVFCTAFRLIYIDQEIGDIISDMLATTGLLVKHPTSSNQLARLVGQLAGHSQQFAPVDTMDQVARQVASHDLPPCMYERLDNRELSKLLVYVFENLRDSSVMQARLTGHVGGVWIATALLWWFDEDVSLEIANEIVLGSQESRLTIALSSIDSEVWVLKVYRELQDAQTLIVRADKEDIRPPTLIPIGSVMNYVEQEIIVHLYEVEPAVRGLTLQVIGELATALALLLAESGHVYVLREADQVSDRSYDTFKTKIASNRTAYLVVGVLILHNQLRLEKCPRRV